MSEVNSIEKSIVFPLNNTLSSDICIYIHLKDESKKDSNKNDSICLNSSSTYNNHNL